MNPSAIEALERHLRAELDCFDQLRALLTEERTALTALDRAALEALLPRKAAVARAQESLAAEHPRLLEACQAGPHLASIIEALSEQDAAAGARLSALRAELKARVQSVWLLHHEVSGLAEAGLSSVRGALGALKRQAAGPSRTYNAHGRLRQAPMGRLRARG